VIVPPSDNGTLPGAGELGLSVEIARALEAAPGMHPQVAAGLVALERSARDRGAEDFVALSPDDRRAVVDEVSVEHPALVPMLVYHTYLRYYRQARVLEGLGLEGRPPHPIGYPLEPGDLSLLDPVRERGPNYRS